MTDRIHMRVQHQRSTAPGPPHDTDDVVAARRGLLHFRFDSIGTEPIRHEHADLPFAARARLQIGVDRIDTH